MAYQTRGRDPLFDSDVQAAIEKRGKELGNAQLMQNFVQLWAPLVASVQQWMKITAVQGGEAVEQAYKDTLQGKVQPDQGLILKM